MSRNYTDAEWIEVGPKERREIAEKENYETKRLQRQRDSMPQAIEDMNYKLDRILKLLQQ